MGYAHRSDHPSGSSRRTFLKSITAASGAAATGCLHRPRPGRGGAPRLFFTSQGKTCLIHADGTGMKVLDLHAPGQATWQPAGFLPDGRVLMLSMEPRRDGPGRPFDEYYHQTPTHVWAYDLDRHDLTELATRDRMAPFYAPQLVLQNGRILVQVIRTRPGQIFNMNLDGSDAREFSGTDEGLPYGMSLSPDGQRVAFHLASPRGYEIWTSDPFGEQRVFVDGGPGRLCFGPAWSPDGQWLAHEDCHAGGDPGHDWADVWMARPNGSERRQLTTGQAMWFGATYGPPGNRGGGSNVVAWTRDGDILFPRRLPGSRVAWEYQANRPDTDHFNREYRPEQAYGGTEICTLSPASGTERVLTQSAPPLWDFRCCGSPDGTLVAFCRCITGEPPALWVMHRDGSGARMLTRGLDDRGADHPRWMPS